LVDGQVEMAERRRRVPGGRHNVVKIKLTVDEFTLVKSSAAEADLPVPHLLAEAVLGWIAVDCGSASGTNAS
jgi:hypothetical protein